MEGDHKAPLPLTLLVREDVRGVMKGETQGSPLTHLVGEGRWYEGKCRGENKVPLSLTSFVRGDGMRGDIYRGEHKAHLSLTLLVREDV